MMGHAWGLGSLNSFLKAGVSQGFWNLLSNVFITKLKKDLRLEYRLLLVVCLLPSVNWFKKVRISSVVMDWSSLSPKRSLNFSRTYKWLRAVFFFGIGLVIIEKIVGCLGYFHVDLLFGLTIGLSAYPL